MVNLSLLLLFNNFSNKAILFFFFTIYHAVLKNLNNKKNKTITKDKDTKEKFYNIELSLVLGIKMVEKNYSKKDLIQIKKIK